MKIGLNLGFLDYWSCGLYVSDLALCVGDWKTHVDGEVEGRVRDLARVDGEGRPTDPAEAKLLSGGFAYPQGEYVVTGEGELLGPGVTEKTSRGWVLNGEGQVLLRVPGNPETHPRVFLPGASPLGADYQDTWEKWQFPFYTPFTTDVATAACLRLLDWNRVNFSQSPDQRKGFIPILEDFRERHWTRGAGMPFWARQKLARGLNMPLWDNIPWGASTDYVREMAKHATQGQRIEFSNEIWNRETTANYHARAINERHPGAAAGAQAARHFQTYQTASPEFEPKFVAMGHTHETRFIEDFTDAYDGPYLSSIGCGAYTVGEGHSLREVLDSAASNVDRTLEGVAAHKKLAKEYGVKLEVYEGGFSCPSTTPEIRVMASRSEEMADVFLDLLTGLETAGVDLFMGYCESTNPTFEWGMRISRTELTPKGAVLAEWMGND